MRLIKFYMSILYGYYSSGPTSSIAYIKTVGVVVLLTLVLFVDMLLITNNVDIILLGLSENRGVAYLKIVLITLPIFVFFILFFNEKKLAEQSYSKEDITKGRIIVLLSFILIILSLPLILIFKNGI